jgi:hypothetical protein
MLDFGVSSPGLGPVPRDFFRGTTQAGSPRLGEKRAARVGDFFGDLLASGADPAQVAFEASILSSRYPAEKTFQPGGSVAMDMLKERLSPESKKDTLAARDFMAQQVLNRGLNPEEKKYVKRERPSAQEFASYLYSSPESYAAAAPTAEEQRMAAYYGRPVYSRTKGGGVQMTGYSGSIDPVEYTGGIL